MAAAFFMKIYAIIKELVSESVEKGAGGETRGSRKRQGKRLVTSGSDRREGGGSMHF